MAAAATAAAMSHLRVSVKWSNKEYKDLDVDPTESLTLFKAQLFTLTGVPPERQKLMVKGKLLKDMADLQRAAAAAAGGGGGDKKTAAGVQPEAIKLILLGTAEGGELQQPIQKTVFLEDLTPAEQARILREKNIEPLPSGIANLGNTCYLASVLQMLRPCHELTAAIRTYIVSNASTAALAVGSSGASHRLGVAVKDFYAHWENTANAAQPLLLVHAIREAFPQFARKSPGGSAGALGGDAYMQQDAEECLVCLLGVLGDMLQKNRTSAAIAALPTSYPKAQNFVEALFAFDTLLSSWRIQPGEDATAAMSRNVEKKLEKRLEFTCFLGTLQNPVNTLDEGLKFSLGEEHIDLGPSTSTTTTNSATDDHAVSSPPAAGVSGTTTLVRSSLFASLPFYLIVHFMRFEWKRSGGQTEKAKVCKSLKFSSLLDVQPFCTEELKEQLRIGRAVVALRRDREAGDGSTGTEAAKKSESKKDGSVKKSDNSTSSTTGGTNSKNEGAAATTEDGGSGTKNSVSNGEGAVGESAQQKKQDDVSKKDGSNKQIYPTGMFNLLGIVTHQGRHADSGHYVGWAKKDQREPRRIEREEREAAAEQARRLRGERDAEEDKEGKNKKEEYVVAPKRRVKPADTWLKFDDDKVSEMPWSQIDLAGGRSDYHIAYLLMFRHCLVEPTEEELETVERMRKEQEMQPLAEQKRRKATTNVQASVATTAKKG